ncbi:hypothetical protein RCH07_002868 [Arthrobacter sp. CG_A4]|nr:hypothetical protein [Arthrobacter sp. CG_A4]
MAREQEPDSSYGHGLNSSPPASSVRSLPGPVSCRLNLPVSSTAAAAATCCALMN